MKPVEANEGRARFFGGPIGLLGVGAVLLAAAHFRWGTGILAWVAPVPLLPGVREPRLPRARDLRAAPRRARARAGAVVGREPAPLASR